MGEIIKKQGRLVGKNDIFEKNNISLIAIISTHCIRQSLYNRKSVTCKCTSYYVALCLKRVSYLDPKHGIKENTKSLRNIKLNNHSIIFKFQYLVGVFTSHPLLLSENYNGPLNCYQF